MSSFMSAGGALVALSLVLSMTPGAAGAAPGPERPRARTPDHARANAAMAAPLTSMRADALTRALDEGAIEASTYALERARSLFDLHAVRERHGPVARPAPHDATMILRDLALRRGGLSRPERDLADTILARPDDQDADSFGIKYGDEPVQHRCGAEPVRVCLHWVESGPHQATPEYVDQAMQVLTTVWHSEIETLGFRAPKDDSSSGDKAGPNGHVDVYLGDVGAESIYGFCATDDPNASRLGSTSYPWWDVSAYCVLDNDYFGFPDGTPQTNLEVTAAHEFFHAVQFAYDAGEDPWLMEGTAVALEDFVYPHIRDNLQFLLASQFVRPQVPTDKTGNGSNLAFMRRYGAWVFWRYLSESLSDVVAADGGMAADPSVIREVWERADASAAMAYGDEYSLQAAAGVVTAHGRPFRRVFADYGVALHLPDDGFGDGAAYRTYVEVEREVERKIVHEQLVVVPGARRDRFDTRLNHLSHKYAALDRDARVSGSARLRLIFELPRRKRGSVANVIVFTDGGVERRFVPLAWDGTARLTIPFGADVQRVVVTLTNSSTRFKNCWDAWTQLSCAGKPLDNRLPFTLKARLLN